MLRHDDKEEGKRGGWVATSLNTQRSVPATILLLRATASYYYYYYYYSYCLLLLLLLR